MTYPNPDDMASDAYEEGYEDGITDWHTEVMMVFEEAKQAFCGTAKDDPQGCDCCGRGMHAYLQQRIATRFNKRER